MEFTYSSKRRFESFAQRSVVMARRGMAASSQPLATLSGYRALARGGNAVDAAVAMAATLSVVEPHMVGIGGDAFALIWVAGDRRLAAMNASGRAPYRATVEWFRDRGMTAIPERGILPATVPGALHGWAEAVGRFGRLTLAEALEDALEYAEGGFPVTEVIAGEWSAQTALLRADPGSARCFLPEGRAPRPGDVFRNPDLAATYRRIIREGADDFYQGEIARDIAAFARRMGGLLSERDLREHATTWTTPISRTYRGATVYETPPNGQGVTALEMLAILEGYDVGGMGHNSPEYLHVLIEAKKIAFSDRNHFVTDPEFEAVPTAELMSDDYAARCRRLIDPHRAMTPPAPMGFRGSDTVYVCAVDGERNAVSLISSIYSKFGSGLVVDGRGIVLQNRGKSFSLEPGHPNRLAPHKRTRHTIIPGMVFEEGEFAMCFGVMGGDMQPQGHVQVLANLLDFTMNPQEALDAPRVCHMQDREVYFEAGIPAETVAALEKMGHQPDRGPHPTNAVGGGQAIYYDRVRDVLLGASDRRKDGCALGY